MLWINLLSSIFCATSLASPPTAMWQRSIPPPSNMQNSNSYSQSESSSSNAYGGLNPQFVQNASGVIRNILGSLWDNSPNQQLNDQRNLQAAGNITQQALDIVNRQVGYYDSLYTTRPPPLGARNVPGPNPRMPEPYPPPPYNYNYPTANGRTATYGELPSYSQNVRNQPPLDPNSPDTFDFDSPPDYNHDPGPERDISRPPPPRRGRPPPPPPPPPRRPPPPSSSDETDASQPGFYDPYAGSNDGGKGSWGSHGSGTNKLAIGLGVGIPLGVLVFCVFLFFFYRWRRNKKERSKQKQALYTLPIPGSTKGNPYELQENSPAISNYDPWELERTKVSIDYEKKLGSGAFCNVFKGKIIDEAPVARVYPGIRTSTFTNCDVAVKMLPSFADDIARSDFMQEINFMKSLPYHEHLVSMLGYVPDKKNPLLLVEFCEKGDLLHFIRVRKNEIIEGPTAYPNGLKIKDLLSFAWQISNGLDMLNSVGCIHRDIAARNVLVDSSNQCKMGDFGLCRLTDSLLYTGRGGRLPLKWMAPESLTSYEYTFKSDVWSYAVLLWEMFSLGEVPFADIQTTDLLDRLKEGYRLKQPVCCPDEVYDVMLKCWELVPERRPSFAQLCKWLAVMLESASDDYGYLIPTRRSHASSSIPPQIDNV